MMPGEPLVRGARRGHLGSLVAVVALAMTTSGPAAAPEIVRVRVPQARVKNVFPPGAELRVLPMAEFDRLARAAEEASRGRATRATAGLLKIENRARLEDGMLVGTSTLRIEPPEGGPGLVMLEPWTPAVDPARCEAASLVTTSDGRTALLVEPELPTTVVIGWSLRARAGSEGLSFALGLPRVAANSLLLDLPAGLTPEGPPGVRQGPTAVEATGRVLWRFDGAAGPAELRLRRSGETAGRLIGAWFGGTTLVEVDAGSARWRADWTIGDPADAETPFEVDLPDGLDVVSITGKNVVSFRTNERRLSIRLSRSGKGAEVVTIRGTAAVPDSGLWAVPGVTPVGASWTGGRTSIRVGPSRVVAGVRRTAALATAATAEERRGRDGASVWLDFETTGPGSPAELALEKPAADIAAEVRGEVRLDPTAAPRLEARIAWRIDRGRLITAMAELPPGWDLTGIRSPAGEGPAPTWQTEPRTGGGTLVHLTPIPPVGAGRTFEATLLAEATGDRPGPFALPRVRAVNVRATDELWTLRAERSLAVRPTKATGLAWVAPSSQATDAALAWRWVPEDGEASVERSIRPGDSSVELVEDVFVTADRLRLDARITPTGSGEPISSVVVSWSGGTFDEVEWRIDGESDAGPLMVKTTAADGDVRQTIDLGRPRTGRFALRATGTRAWTGSGRVPILTSGETRKATIRLHAAQGLRTSVEASGLRRLDPAFETPRRAEGGGTANEVLATRPAHAFGGLGRPSSLLLKTESLRSAAPGGVIAEARLRSRPAEGPRVSERLELAVAPGDARDVKIGLPNGTRLERVSVDGRAVKPLRAGDEVDVPLTAPTPSRPVVAVVMDYSRAATAGAIGMPTFSLPCQDFCWWIEPLRESSVELPGSGLTRQDRPATFDRPAWTATSLRPMGRLTGKHSEAAGSDAGKRLGGLAGREVTLGEILSRLDAGAKPWVVDRMALRGRGVRAWSRVAVPRDVASSSDPTGRLLGPLGLELVATANGVLVTGAEEAVALRAEGAVLEEAVRSTVRTGCDPSDRFATVLRWRDSDPNVRAETHKAAGEEHTGAAVFASAGTPGRLPMPRLVAADALTAAAWGGGLLMAAVGLALRRAGGRLRAVVLAAALLSMAAAAYAGPLGMSLAVGGAWGATAALGFWIGGSLRRPSRRRPGPQTTSSLRSRGSKIGAAAGAGVVVIAAMVFSATAQAPSNTPPILAVIPEPEPAGGAHVLLSLVDDARLRQLAGAGSGRQSAIGPLASSAEHRIEPLADRRVAIVDRYAVRAFGEGTHEWTFPVGAARGLSAQVDGRDVPVLVENGGARAKIAFRGARASLVVRRVFARETRESVQAVDAPVVPVATALLHVPQAVGAAVDMPGIRGVVTAEADGRRARLGPTGRIVLEWPAEEGQAANRPGGSAEAWLLWDARPAGDRLTARIGFRGLRDPSRLRIGLDPGWTVVSAEVPGLIDGRMGGTAERPEWVGRCDPPLPTDGILRLELWRPVPGAVPDAPRAFPRAAPLDVASFVGTLAFRRPVGWNGRLRSVAGTDPWPEDDFIKTWGAPAGDRMETAGAIRYATAPRIDVTTAPAAGRLSASTAVTADAEAGRVRTSAALTAATAGEPLHELSISLPRGFRVDSVAAEGLTDWRESPPGRLALRFDRDDAAKRSISVTGAIPSVADPMGAPGSEHRLAAPWFEIPGAIAEVGSLSLTSPLEPAAGRLRPQSASGGRTAYRVERTEDLGLIVWREEPPRVLVDVRSLVTIHPDSAAWDALVRYRSSGGPLTRLAMRLPADWAAGAVVSAPGVPFTLEKSREGTDARWTVVPARPEWGEVTLRVRGDRPLGGRGIVQAPDLVPLGRGSVDTYLALAGATSRPISVEGSAGLQQVDYARFAAPVDAVTRGRIRDVFHVMRDGWSLRVRVGDDETAAGEGREPVRVEAADVTATLNADGSLIARASYRVEPNGGTMLAIRLPAGAEPTAAEVDGRPVRPLRSAGDPQGVLVPLGDDSARRVVVAWRATLMSEADGRRTIGLPRGPAAAAPMLVSLRVPEGSVVEPNGGGVTAASAAMLDALRSDRLARRIASRVPSLDRSDPKKRAELLGEVARFLLLVREAGRAAAVPARADSTATAEERGRVANRLRTATATVSAALAEAGLEEFETSARSRTGEAVADPMADLPGVQEPTSPIRVPTLGEMHGYQVTSDAGDSATLSLRPPPRKGPLARFEGLPAWFATAALLLLLTAGALRPGAEGTRRAAWATAAALLLAAGFAGPQALGIVTTALLVGRISA